MFVLLYSVQQQLIFYFKKEGRERNDGFKITTRRRPIHKNCDLVDIGIRAEREHTKPTPI